MPSCSSPVAVAAVSVPVSLESFQESSSGSLPEVFRASLSTLLQRTYAVASSSDGAMGNLEEEVGQAGRELQRQVLEMACQFKADNCAPNCPCCGAPLSRVSVGRERTIQTRFGAVRIVRSYGYCRHCAQWFFPADFELGLTGDGQSSPSLQEAAALAVSKIPCGDAVAVLGRLAGLDVSRATLDREARRQGKRAEELRDDMDAKALDTRGRWDVTQEVRKEWGKQRFSLVIQIDAWNIRERDGWGRTQELTGQGEAPGRWHWVYGATVFRLEDRGQTQSGRPVILSRGYVMTRLGTDALANQLFAEAVRQGMLIAEDVLVIADGGVWIWKIADERFPWAKKRLDFFHASEHLWEVARELHGAGTAEAKAWVEPLLHQLRHGEEERVLQTLDDLKQTVARKHRELVSREAAYFESHREHLDYSAGAAAGEPIGSGAMESTCRQYQCRFKRPGQFWSKDGDEALLALETFWRNGRWHLLFPHAGRVDPARN